MRTLITLLSAFSVGVCVALAAANSGALMVPV
jgi:hypothetical protein